VSIERERVQIKLDRGDPISTLEIDVEVPSAAAAAALRDERPDARATANA
jgi:septum formation topological specificity factor MinE